MSIAALGTVLDAAVYVEGYTPTGDDVGADITRVIVKVDEISTQVNTNTDGLASEASTRAAADAVLQALATDNAETNDAQDLRLDALEAADPTFNTKAWETGDAALDFDDYTQNDLIILEAQSATNTSHALPLTGSGDPYTLKPVTILNNGHTYSQVYLDNGTWLGGQSGSGSANYIKLLSGEAVTVWPAPNVGGSGFKWAILGGNNSGLESDP